MVIRRSDCNEVRKEWEMRKPQIANRTASFLTLGCGERAEAGE